MKYNIAILALVATLTETQAISITQSQYHKQNGDSKAAIEEDIDSLMDKYDTQEKNASKEKTQKKVDKPKTGGPSASEVQDMELKILEGNNLAESSEKDAEDDMINGVLEKYLQPGKSDKDLKEITKNDAQEAASDIYQEKKKIDSFEAQSQVNQTFQKLWAEHDILNNNKLDQNEAYALMAEVAKSAI